MLQSHVPTLQILRLPHNTFVLVNNPSVTDIALAGGFNFPPQLPINVFKIANPEMPCVFCLSYAIDDDITPCVFVIDPSEVLTAKAGTVIEAKTLAAVARKDAHLRVEIVLEGIDDEINLGIGVEFQAGGQHFFSISIPLKPDERPDSDLVEWHTALLYLLSHATVDDVRASAQEYLDILGCAQQQMALLVLDDSVNLQCSTGGHLLN